MAMERMNRNCMTGGDDSIMCMFLCIRSQHGESSRGSARDKPSAKHSASKVCHFLWHLSVATHCLLLLRLFTADPSSVLSRVIRTMRYV